VVSFYQFEKGRRQLEGEKNEAKRSPGAMRTTDLTKYGGGGGENFYTDLIISIKKQGGGESH